MARDLLPAAGLQFVGLARVQSFFLRRLITGFERKGFL